MQPLFAVVVAHGVGELMFSDVLQPAKLAVVDHVAHQQHSHVP